MTDHNRLVKKTTNDLLAEREELSREIMAADGELSPEIEARLFANTQSLAEKADAIHWVVERLEAEEAFLKAQAKRLTDAARSRARQSDLIRQRIKALMLEHDAETLSGETTEFYLTRAKAKLVGEGLPEGFTKQTVTIEPDLEAIRDALEDGRQVAGYALEPNHALRNRVAVKRIT
jgi:hypothetical protein